MSLIRSGGEATQVEANFLAKTIIGDFYLKLSKSLYTLQIALLIISSGTPLHTGQPDVSGCPHTVCAEHGAYLGGESPLWGLQCQPLAEGKGVHREVESEGSRRQNPEPRNTN